MKYVSFEYQLYFSNFIILLWKHDKISYNLNVKYRYIVNLKKSSKFYFNKKCCTVYTCTTHVKL